MLGVIHTIIKSRVLTSLILGYFICFPFQVSGQNSTRSESHSGMFIYKKLTSPSPAPEAEALFRYLQHQSNERILSGQMCTKPGFNEMEYIRSITGKYPAIRGFDFAKESEMDAQIKQTVDWWKNEGIPLIKWTWRAPGSSNRYGNSLQEVEIDKCFQPGTSEYRDFWKELENKADYLEKLRDTHVPVLWCPFHEPNQSTHWWGKQGPGKFKKLWQTMFDYLVYERQLNNLIWVLCFYPDIQAEWFPGKNYVDISGISSYEKKGNSFPELFKVNQEYSGSLFTPLSFQKCSNIPHPDDCRKDEAMWNWWIQHQDPHMSNQGKDFLTEVYLHDLVITQDELPKISMDFGKEAVLRQYKTGSTIPFTDLKAYSLGTKAQTLLLSPNRIVIESNGKGIDGKKDECYLLFQLMEGDFDVSVQVPALKATHLYTMAGIMARTDLSKGSQHVFFHIYPNNTPKGENTGGFEFKYRLKKSRETFSVFPDPGIPGGHYNIHFPNVWIRLKRRGNQFKSYISTNNTHWRLYAVHQQQLPKKLLVGLAVSSHNETAKTTAEFKHMEVTWE